MSIPNVALIGVTGYGHVHLSCLQEEQKAGGCRVRAATVINPDDAPEQMSWLRENHVEVFDDYRRMLEQWAGKIDLCCIPTAISLHRSMTEAALAAGAHVLVEKPLAGCPADARAIIEAGEKAGRFVCVGFQAVWSPLTRRILDAIHSGQLGTIQRIVVTGIWPRPQSYYRRNGWAGRLSDRNGIVNDSPANNALAHFLNLALLFAGPAPFRCARVRATRAELSRVNPIESYDTVLADLETDTGVGIFYGVTHAAAEQTHPLIQITGDKGTAEWSMDQGKIEIEGAPSRQFPGAHEDESRAGMFREVLAAAAGENGLLFPASEALAHVEAVAAIADAGAITDRQSEAVVVGENTGDPIHTLPGMAEKILAARRVCAPQTSTASPAKGTSIPSATRFRPSARPAGFRY